MTIENIPGRPERRYCTAAHRAAARQARRAAMQPEQRARLVETLPWLAEPEPEPELVLPPAAPPPAAQTTPRGVRRNAIAVLGVVAILAGGYAVTSSQPAAPVAEPVQGAPPVAEGWAARAEVTLVSVDQQLDVLAKTEAAWNSAGVLQAGTTPPGPVVALQDRKALLERRKVVLRSQLDSYRSLGRARTDLMQSERDLDAVESVLRNTSSSATPTSPDDATALVVLEEQRALRQRQRDAKRAELAGLEGNVERAARTPLPDDGEETAAVSEQVMEVIHTGGRDRRAPEPTRGPRRPEVVAGRESGQAEERQVTTTSAPPDPRGPRDESEERRAGAERRAARAQAERERGPLGKIVEAVGGVRDRAADEGRHRAPDPPPAVVAKAGGGARASVPQADRRDERSRADREKPAPRPERKDEAERADREKSTPRTEKKDEAKHADREQASARSEKGEAKRADREQAPPRSEDVDEAKRAASPAADRFDAVRGNGDQPAGDAPERASDRPAEQRREPADAGREQNAPVYGPYVVVVVAAAAAGSDHDRHRPQAPGSDTVEGADAVSKRTHTPRTYGDPAASSGGMRPVNPRSDRNDDAPSKQDRSRVPGSDRSGPGSQNSSEGWRPKPAAPGETGSGDRDPAGEGAGSRDTIRVKRTDADGAGEDGAGTRVSSRDTTSTDRSGGNQLATEKRSGEDQRDEEESGEERPGAGQTGRDQGGTATTSRDRTGGEARGGEAKPTERESGGEKSGGEKAGAEKAGGEKAGGEKAGGEKSRADRSGATTTSGTGSARPGSGDSRPASSGAEKADAGSSGASSVEPVTSGDESHTEGTTSAGGATARSATAASAKVPAAKGGSSSSDGSGTRTAAAGGPG